MNAIFFGAKRAFQGSLRLTRPWLAPFGLTAARFDLLTVIRQHPHGIHQRDLPRWLGVTRATISRMLLSLEALGLVKRLRSLADRRLWHLQLTVAGRQAIESATESLVDSGKVQKEVDAALSAGRTLSEEERLREMGMAQWLFKRLRDAFGDVAHLHYMWEPED